jgi:hypothetical protein
MRPSFGSNAPRSSRARLYRGQRMSASSWAAIVDAEAVPNTLQIIRAAESARAAVAHPPWPTATRNSSLPRRRTTTSRSGHLWALTPDHPS